MRNRISAALALLLALTSAGLSQSGDVGRPAFQEIRTATMILRYGFAGAAVRELTRNDWSAISMTTLTRGRVEGHVNQANAQFALAAGLHSVAVYDVRKHEWCELKGIRCDDTPALLEQNFVLTATSVRVKMRAGGWVEYTSEGGWARLG